MGQKKPPAEVGPIEKTRRGSPSRPRRAPIAAPSTDSPPDSSPAASPACRRRGLFFAWIASSRGPAISTMPLAILHIPSNSEFADQASGPVIFTIIFPLQDSGRSPDQGEDALLQVQGTEPTRAPRTPNTPRAAARRQQTIAGPDSGCADSHATVGGDGLAAADAAAATRSGASSWSSPNFKTLPGGGQAWMT